MIYNNQKCFQEVLESRIDKELDQYPQITKKMIEDISKTNYKGLHIKIINQKLINNYEKPSYELRNTRLLQFLDFLVNNYELPNTEFILHSEDTPPITDGPLFVQSKLPEHNTILYPDFSFIRWDWLAWPEASTECWGDFRNNILSYHTQNKINQCFFRGVNNTSSVPIAGTQRIRNNIYELVKNNILYNIKFVDSNNRQYYVPTKEFVNYKYLLNLPGGSSSGRFKYLFLMKSIVFNVQGKYTEFWYHVLKDRYHYFNFYGETPEDIVKQMTSTIEMLESDIKLYETYVQNAQEIAEYFTFESVINYWLTLIKKYTSRLSYEIK